ncbi:Lytic transglycosylase, catalytic [Sphingomonas antarctica]|uniref:lytic transglycosylase domain-containing protein n=1 Tax=Sphingomonas antarctica TaxID=2040274 RepID=UPI0039EBB072
MKLTYALSLLCACAAPALAQKPALTPQLLPQQRADYGVVFAAIKASDWTGASAKLDAMGIGPLHAEARALILTAKNSPKAEADQLAAAAFAARDLPEGAILVRLATTRGAAAVPQLPEVRDLRWLGSAPRRGRTATVGGDAVAQSLGPQLLQMIKDDRPADAEALIAGREGDFQAEPLTEWRQRVAWSYFLTGNDVAARALAAKARTGYGEWAAQADWVEGLAAWRQKDFGAALAGFDAVARRAADSEMVAAGHFWAARAAMAAGRPEQIQPHQRAAAQLGETFYGMLAQAALGLAAKGDDDGAGQFAVVAGRPAVAAAIALSEIGESERADSLLRWQARIGLPAEHATLTLIAGKLGLPATQLWLAHNGPAGARTTIEGRYPSPETWAPEGGWRVDRSLVFAHALQESNFRADAVSKAGARGLMQVLPTTAALIQRTTGLIVSGGLNSPAANMAFGQKYIEQLADMAATGGALPKVIAAYNCGPAPVARWNVNSAAQGDPLLYIESIPYWETRGYVATVLRNYWMYQQQAGKPTISRDALLQGSWPTLPREGTQLASR